MRSRATAAGADVEVDVLICGLGPVGAIAATLLGLQGVRVLAVDRAREVYPMPRGIALDGEALRILEGLDLGDLMAPINGHQRVRFCGADAQLLVEVVFDDAVNAMPGLAFFRQPELEHALRAGLQRQPTVEIALGCELEAFVDGGDGVRARLRDPDADTLRTVDARYLLGCDGAKSMVRNALRVGFGGSTYEERWLVADLRLERPLAHRPYHTARCDPRRPNVDMPMPGGHRFEWMVHPHESIEEMVAPERVRDLLGVHVDPDAVEIERAVVYTFHARVADRWRVGRTFLLGDAAHAMPPFAGQGLATGIGDAANLAWKLAAVLDGRAGERLLDSYERERRAYVKGMINLTRFVGTILQTRDARTAAIRDRFFGTAARTPVVGPFLARGGLKPSPALPRRARARLLARRSSGGGMRIPRARLRMPDGRVVFVDEVIGHRYALLGFGVDPRDALDADACAIWDRLGADCFRVVARGRRRWRSSGRPPADDDVLELEDLDGTLERFLRRRGEIAIVRPDRFVLVIARRDELAQATRAHAASIDLPRAQAGARLLTTRRSGLGTLPLWASRRSRTVLAAVATGTLSKRSATRRSSNSSA